MIEQTLVSVIVITYNSSKTVLETLDSIASQTYQSIELIVSDDCSTDDTINIVKAWLNRFGDRFKRVKLISVNKNTGVCGNLNRALKECHGQWIKEIAADDILLPNCIDDFISFVEKNPDVSWASSYVSVFDKRFEKDRCINQKFVVSRAFFEKQATEQLHSLAAWNKISAPSLFIKISLFSAIGDYDETYGFEDYVFSLKALENGYKCYFLDKETVGYRVGDSTFNSINKLFNYSFLLKCRKFQVERCFKYLTKRQILWTKILWCFEDLIVKLKCNIKNKFMVLIYSRFTKFCKRLGNI